MAKKLKKVTIARHGRGDSYPWEQWFDGNMWSLTRGVDFKATPVNFRRSAYGAAKRHGVRIETRVQGDVVEFQCLGKREG